MSDFIFDEALVVHVHGFESESVVIDVELVSAFSGPAGEAVVELSDSVRVVVDYAQPNLLVAISISPEEPTAADHIVQGKTSELLEALIGSTRVEQLQRALAKSSKRSTRISSSGQMMISSLWPNQTEMAILLGRVASATSVMKDREEELSVRLIAAAEGFILAQRFDNPTIRDSLVERLEITVSEMLNISDLEILLPQEVVSDLRELADRHGGVAFEVERVMQDVQNHESDIFALLAFAIMGVQSRAGAPEMLHAFEYEPMHLSESLALSQVVFNAPVIAQSLRIGRLELMWDTNPDGTWARILDPQDLTLIAMVPVRKVDKHWVAEAIVPPGRPSDFWIVEVTDSPLPVSQKSASERILEAVKLGQFAARLQPGTLQPPDEQRNAWMACAEAWQELGDEFRANKARNFADGEPVSRRTLVADYVRMALGLDDI